MAWCGCVLSLFVCGVHYSTEPPDCSVLKHVCRGAGQGSHIHSIGTSCCSSSNPLSCLGVGTVPDGLVLFQEENSPTGWSIYRNFLNKHPGVLGFGSKTIISKIKENSELGYEPVFLAFRH